MLKIVLKEVIGLCLKLNFLLLRKLGKKDFEKFNLEFVCNEWCKRVLVFYLFLFIISINKRIKDLIWFVSFVLVGLIFLK